MSASGVTFQGDHAADELHRVVTRVYRKLRSMELPSGMTYERMCTLATLDRSGPMSMSDLASAEGVQPSSMSRMIRFLHADGLVSREGSEHDRRGVVVACTPKGRQAYRRASALALRTFREALGSLSMEQLAAVRELTTALGVAAGTSRGDP
jgi:DNA-binding MarR family transcriptional regulator